MHLKFRVISWVICVLGLRKVSSSACGGADIQLSGEKMDVNFPRGGNFTMAETCNYTITGTVGKKLAINVNSLELGLGGNCDNDYFKVADTPDGITKTEQVACGDRPQSFTVSGHTMAIQLKATNEPQKSFVSTTIFQTSPGQSQCGKENIALENEETQLMFPRLGAFRQAETCNYIITGTKGKNLTIKITEINLGPGGNCDNDYFKVADNPDGLAKTEQVACGDRPQTFTMSGDTMAIQLKATNEPEKSFVRTIVIQMNTAHRLLLNRLVVRCTLQWILWSS